MRIFESILDDRETSVSNLGSADAVNSSAGYEAPSDDKHRNIIVLANGRDNYEELVANSALLEERFVRLQETVPMFRHLKSHSDFQFVMHPQMAAEVIPYFVTVGYQRAGFRMSFDADFRSEKETAQFVCVLNEIATGGEGGSVTLKRGIDEELFIDYENIDWIAHKFNVPIQRKRPFNVFYSSGKVDSLSSRLFHFLKEEDLKDV